MFFINFLVIIFFKITNYAFDIIDIVNFCIFKQKITEIYLILIISSSTEVLQ